MFNAKCRGCFAGNIALIKENSEYLVDVPAELLPATPMKVPTEDAEQLRLDFQVIANERLACELKIHGHLLKLPLAYAQALFCVES
jgi:hypothetical protein